MRSNPRERADAVPIGEATTAAAYRLLPANAVAVVPGLAAAVAIAIAATGLGRAAPAIGSPIFAVVIGITIAVVRRPKVGLRRGIAFSARHVLQAAIVATGFSLSFREVFTTGTSSLPIIAGTLFVALAGTQVIGRFFGISDMLRLLIGVGTGICGASAIAATSAVVDASELEISYAISTIFTFNLVAIGLFPLVGRGLGMSAHAFGLWTGTAVNDMSSVVATSTIFGKLAVRYAVVVKLTRTVAIVPIVLILSATRMRRDRRGSDNQLPSRRTLSGAFPAFIGWFLVAVGVNTLGWVPTTWHNALNLIPQFLVAVALGAIGLSTDLGALRHTGLRPLAFGATLWVLVALTSLVIQSAVGQLK